MQFKIMSHHTNGNTYDDNYNVAYNNGFAKNTEIGYDIDDFGTFDFAINTAGQTPSAAISCPTCNPPTQIGYGAPVTLTVKFTLNADYTPGADVLRLDIPVSNEAYSAVAGVTAMRMSSTKSLYRINNVQPSSVTVQAASGFTPDIVLFELSSALTAGTEYSLVYTGFNAPPIKKALTGIAFAHFLQKAASNSCPVLPSGCTITPFIATTDIDVSMLVSGSLTALSVAITVG